MWSRSFLFEKSYTEAKFLSLIGIPAFALFTAAAAGIRIYVPGIPVPFTLQTACVMGAGLALGSKKGLLSQLLYVVLGSLGVSWFAGGSGALLSLPTAGYILSFPLAAYIAGMAEGKGIISSLLLLTAASASVLIFGFLWLCLTTSLGPEGAFKIGALPFIWVEGIKVAFIAFCKGSFAKIRS